MRHVRCSSISSIPWVAGGIPTLWAGVRAQSSSRRSSSTREPSKPSIRSIAPAAAAAAPAGIRPTSSEPATSTPRARRLRGDPSDDLVERGRLPVLDVHAHLDNPGARQRQAQCPHAREAAVALPHDRGDRPRDLDVVGPQVDVERDQRPPRADEHRARAGVELRRPEVRRQLPCVDPRAGAPPVRRAGRTPARDPGRRTGTPEAREHRAAPPPPATRRAHAPCPPGGSAQAGRRRPHRHADGRPRATAGRSATARTRRPRRAHRRAPPPNRPA